MSWARVRVSYSGEIIGLQMVTIHNSPLLCTDNFYGVNVTFSQLTFLNKVTNYP